MKFYRVVSIVMVIILSMNIIGCSMESVKETASSTAGSVGEVATSAKESVTNWYASLDFSKFQDGWDYSKEFMAANYSALVTSEFMTSEYVANLESAITTLKTDMNASVGSARGTAQEAGYLAEKWATDTFNINAIANGSPERAETVGSTELGSVDVSTTYGENASLKYYKDVSGSASAQARSILKAYRDYKAGASGEPMSLKDYLDKNGYDPSLAHDELLASIYEGQTRIIPKDQLPNAKAYLQGRIDKLPPLGSGDFTDAQIRAYQETMDNLRDRLQAPDGTESKPLKYEELQGIAEVSQNGDFKPEDFGVSLSSVLGPKYVVKQAMGTGLEMAAINTALTVGPDVFSILREAAKKGALDEEELKECSVEGAISASGGFVEGSVSRMVATMCKSGAFGETLKGADPSIVATITVLMIEAAIHGYELSKGIITADEYGNMMVDETMVMLLALPTTALFLAVLPATHIAYLAGSMAGGLVASMGYLTAKEAVLDIVDGGGFEAIIPVETKNTMSIATEKIASLHISENASSFKDTCVSTASNGLIKVQAITDKKK